MVWCPCDNLFIKLSVRLSIWSIVGLSRAAFIGVAIYPLVCLSVLVIGLDVGRCDRLFKHLSGYPSICAAVYLWVYLSTYLFLCRFSDPFVHWAISSNIVSGFGGLFVGLSIFLAVLFSLCLMMGVDICVCLCVC